MQTSGDGSSSSSRRDGVLRRPRDGTVQVRSPATTSSASPHGPQALRRHGGRPVTGTFKLALRRLPAYPLPLPVPQKPGDPAGVWEVSRLSLPLPTILPSYNQIGFDSLIYFVGLVEGSAPRASPGWPAASSSTPATRPSSTRRRRRWCPSRSRTRAARHAPEPRRHQRRGDERDHPASSFRMAASVAADGTADGGRAHRREHEVRRRPDVRVLPGAARLLQPADRSARRPRRREHGPVPGRHASRRRRASGRSPSGPPRPRSGQPHRILPAPRGSRRVVLLVDAQTGLPVSLDYGLVTTRTAGSSGTLAGVSVDLTGKTLPAMVRAYLMIDTYPAAVTTLAPP